MKHFLGIEETTGRELEEILALSRQLKAEWKAGKGRAVLAGKILGMLFEKPSLRTRVSFEVAMLQLGGEALYLSPFEVQMGQRETVSDVARVLSRYVDCLMGRVFDHAVIRELARYAGVPVINGLSDREHPCQAVGDLLTIAEKLGGFKGVKLAYVGDGNNVLHSLLLASAKVGMDLAAATPSGYGPDAGVVALAYRAADESGAKIWLGDDPREAVRGADVVYTDVWASMGQEAEGEERRKAFQLYQLNAELLSQARPGALVMHCLPAHRGEEITDELMESPQAVVFDQAENRLHGQKGILARLFST